LVDTIDFIANFATTENPLVTIVPLIKN